MTNATKKTTKKATKTETELQRLAKSLTQAKRVLKEAQARDKEVQCVQKERDAAIKPLEAEIERVMRPYDEKIAAIKLTGPDGYRAKQDVRKIEQMIARAHQRQRAAEDRKRLLNLGTSSE